MQTLITPVKRCGAVAGRGWRGVQGFRTYGLFGVGFLLTLLDALHAVDLQGMLMDLGLPEVSAKAVVAGCCLLGIVLRSVTSTPPGRRDG